MKPSPAYVVIHNATTEQTLCRRAELAVAFGSRLVGLLGRRGFETTDGLLLRPSSSVHTVGMQFSIDVIALDRERRVVALRRELRAAACGADAARDEGSAGTGCGAGSKRVRSRWATGSFSSLYARFRSASQAAVQPPSMLTIEPVMKEASSEQR